MRILFITSNRLGDAVLSTGLLSHLASAHAGARITVACGPVPAPIFRAAPGVERIIPLTKARRGGHWVRLWRHCVMTAWDLVVDLRDTPVSRLIRARRRVVWRRPSAPLHKVEELAAVLDLAPPPAPRLWFDDAAETEARAWIPDGPPILALAPTANWRGKEWPADRFVALAERLTGSAGILAGARVAVIAAPDERDRAEVVLDALASGGPIDLIGRGDPLAAGACLARCALFVGNDSGLMHIAAAVGTPTLGLFGPGQPDVYRPWGPRAAHIVAPRSEEEGTHTKGADLMARIEPDAALRAAEALCRAAVKDGRASSITEGPEEAEAGSRERPRPSQSC